MPTEKSFIDYIADCLRSADGVRFRPMMGEYVAYYKDKVIGGVYDNRFLVKTVPSALKLLPEAELVTPYAGAKKMLAVDCLEDAEFMRRFLDALYPELPLPKKKK